MVLVCAGKTVFHPVGEEFPVGISPAVYALLHIAHYKALVAAGIAFRKERQEVVPLHIGSILKLVQQEIGVADSQFFIDERSVAVRYNLLQQ